MLARAYMLTINVLTYRPFSWSTHMLHAMLAVSCMVRLREVGSGVAVRCDALRTRAEIIKKVPSKVLDLYAGIRVPSLGRGGQSMQLMPDCESR